MNLAIALMQIEIIEIIEIINQIKINISFKNYNATTIIKKNYLLNMNLFFPTKNVQKY